MAGFYTALPFLGGARRSSSNPYLRYNFIHLIGKELDQLLLPMTRAISTFRPCGFDAMEIRRSVNVPRGPIPVAVSPGRFNVGHTVYMPRNPKIRLVEDSLKVDEPLRYNHDVPYTAKYLALLFAESARFLFRNSTTAIPIYCFSQTPYSGVQIYRSDCNLGAFLLCMQEDWIADKFDVVFRMAVIQA